MITLTAVGSQVHNSVFDNSIHNVAGEKIDFRVGGVRILF